MNVKDLLAKNDQSTGRSTIDKYIKSEFALSSFANLSLVSIDRQKNYLNENDASDLQFNKNQNE